jgi:hypothetical protein
MRKILAVLCVLFVSAIPAFPGAGLGAVHYVCTTGSIVYPYSTVATAARDIQTAVNACSNNDRVVLVPGRYYLTSQVVVSNSVLVSSLSGPENTIVDGQGLTRCFYLSPTASGLDKLTVVNGIATGGFPDNAGGGAYAEAGVSGVFIWQCQFRNCRATYGGAIFADNAQISDCMMTSNTAYDLGGGIRGVNATRLQRCQFYYNVASNYGGGAALNASAAENCIAQYNHSNQRGGGFDLYGSCQLWNSIVTQNSAHDGGGVHAMAGGSLYNVYAAHNLATNEAGGVNARAGGATLVNCSIIQNRSSVRGGGLYTVDATVSNCLFYANESPSDVDCNTGIGIVYDHVRADPTPPGSANTDADPLVVSISDLGYSLGAGSPCIDAGGYDSILMPTTKSLNARNRIILAPDIGASEFGSDVNDYDYRGKANLAVFNAGNWYIRTLAGPLVTNANWGFTGCVPVPGDYVGYGIGALTVFYPPSGNWYIRSPWGSVYAMGTNWGFNGCTPVTGDYDGDGRADLAVFYPPNGTWYIRTLRGTVLRFAENWGFSGCIPVAGDYDGDGEADMAVFYPNTGNWYIRTFFNGVITMGLSFGYNRCVPVPGDYNGDGRSDLAVYDTANGNWYIRSLTGLPSETTLAWGLNWGFAGATPVGGDFDGDGYSDLAVYHQATGRWYVYSLRNGILASGSSWGWSAAVPVKP